jgi:hypothetical protein
MMREIVSQVANKLHHYFDCEDMQMTRGPNIFYTLLKWQVAIVLIPAVVSLRLVPISLELQHTTFGDVKYVPAISDKQKPLRVL